MLPPATDVVTGSVGALPSAGRRPTSSGPPAAASRQVATKDKLLGNLDATNDEEDRRLPVERWPGQRLTIVRHTDEHLPTMPTRE